MRRRSQAISSKQQQSIDKKSILIDNRMDELLDKLISSANTIQSNNYKPLLKQYKKQHKHPILQTLPPGQQIFRPNPDRKKKPIQLYLDTVNTIYKRIDFQMLINPVNVVSPFENWCPREIAVFEGAIVKFGNQFDVIAELVQTKTAKECYQFYWEWKGTSHYKSYKTYQSFNSKMGQL